MPLTCTNFFTIISGIDEKTSPSPTPSSCPGSKCWEQGELGWGPAPSVSPIATMTAATPPRATEQSHRQQGGCLLGHRTELLASHPPHAERAPWGHRRGTDTHYTLGTLTLSRWERNPPTQERHPPPGTALHSGTAYMVGDSSEVRKKVNCSSKEERPAGGMEEAGPR